MTERTNERTYVIGIETILATILEHVDQRHHRDATKNNMKGQMNECSTSACEWDIDAMHGRQPPHNHAATLHAPNTTITRR